MTTSVGDLRRGWARWKKVPGGPWLFSRLFGVAVPYAAGVRPRILELSPGHARISMNDRRSVRNHLTSIHAVALANLAEMTTGLALGFGLPDGMRTILTRLEIDFLKKARGRITATCEAPVFDRVEEKEVRVESVLTNEAGDVVARGRAVWLAGPVRR
jgi:acyl-coenzyme A thioesterase PaaI-like protein